ncbi:MAG: NADH-quinone oxidoreductase subunit L [Candidatus Amulumruptor caecigallinarius]|nr:NADH-quinone oxidoreductase subunit L [Candidatus Amulumruptor caecigallinarius]MCM1397811.1 NADH-quinone oxidoreductase subunit L [Candidatus Amulumruptor caecigallinarius]MCM1454861.1 NADH-quinone oxidoreductase subunit L [bacterium]
MTLPLLILVIPLFMFLLLGLVGCKMSHRTAGTLGCLGMGTTLVLAYITAFTYFFSGNPEFVADSGERLQHIIFNVDWLQFTDTLCIRLGFLLDPISAMMLVVITTISFMVHIYSLGYMRDHHGVYEKGFQRFYAFLSLFSFSMLGLVVATNIFQMYIFWELVGASSYLLIGFYYTKWSAVSASKKAFIVTRFADLGFLIGILILSYYTGTFDFMALTSAPVDGMADTYAVTLNTADSVKNIFATSAAPMFMGASVLTWALVLIFMGGMGKSAMMPLHIWLPDAMEGPTPVSALIHAATMVVAGVYLVARLFPLYLMEVSALEIVTWVGAITAFYAAAVACTQLDIKRVLAFSTISQIAFMMVSLGVARPEIHEGMGYMASMFHLFTHAMFKALLFLGAGAIIHAVGSNDYTDMHGLHKYMPITNWTFLIGCISIAGIIPWSGFFSKDEILTACLGNSTFAYIWMALVAGMTAFYMFRLYFLIFWWKDHKVQAGHHQPHDQALPMTLPLVFLAAVSCVAGFIPFGHFVTWNGEPYDIHLNWTVAGISLAVSVVAILLAYKLYFRENAIPAKMKAALPRLWDWSFHRFYWDELYMFITKRIIFNGICKPIAWFDRHIIDGTMNGFAIVTNKLSFAIRGLQSGNVQLYVWWYLVGAVLLGGIVALCVM